jgi:hypothetical protein
MECRSPVKTNRYFYPRLIVALQGYDRARFIAGFIISALGGSRVQVGGPTGAFIVIVYGIILEYGYFIQCAVRPRRSGRGYKARYACNAYMT